MNKYRNLHSGQTCLVIGNGPTLRQIPHSLLNKYPSFGTNRIYLLPAFTPTYYVAINELVIKQSIDPIRAMNSIKFIRFPYHDQIPGAYPLKKAGAGVTFSLDPTTGIHEGWTVTFVCLQLAYWMGFTRVLLVGVDHRYQQDGRPNQTVVSEQSDPNHFDNNYFGPGVVWQLADLDRSYQFYKIAGEIYKAAGREIINLTPGTALDVFPLADWRGYA